jgi:hypothetical protein
VLGTDALLALYFLAVAVMASHLWRLHDAPGLQTLRSALPFDR